MRITSVSLASYQAGSQVVCFFSLEKSTQKKQGEIKTLGKKTKLSRMGPQKNHSPELVQKFVWLISVEPIYSMDFASL